MRVLIAAVAAILPACGTPERPIPRTELPKLPPSASMPCPKLTEAEMATCVKDGDSRAICTKAGQTCLILQDLQNFVGDTWSKRDQSGRPPPRKPADIATPFTTGAGS